MDRQGTPTVPVSVRDRRGRLGEVLASGALARLVALFALHPTIECHFRELQRITGLPNRSLQRELGRLGGLGLLGLAHRGRRVIVSAVDDDRRWAVLRDTVRAFCDPADLLTVALGRIPGIAAAFVYGSFAQRTGVHERSDVDVFVLGETVDEVGIRLALAQEALEVAGFLGREVNVARFTPQRLRARYRKPFLAAVLAGPREWLIGDDRAVRSALRGARPAARERKAAVA